MKRALITIILLGFAVLQLPAASSKQKLANTLFREQRTAEKQIVELWESGKRGKEMEKVLADYTVRELRLQTMIGKTYTRSLLSELFKQGKSEFSNPSEMASAIVREYYRKKGKAVDKHSFVEGTYYIRKKTMKKADPAETKWN